MRFIFLILLFTTRFCFAQVVERDIERINICDTVLLSQIHKMIYELPSYGGHFEEGHGYVNLYIQRFSPSSDTTMVYFLNPTVNSLEERNVDNLYPDSYDLIDNKLVTIYIGALGRNYFTKNSFTSFSKKMMRDLMDKYAAPTVPFDDGKGHVTNARITYFNFGGTKIYIKRKGPPIIKKVAEG